MTPDTRPPKLGRWTEPALRVLRERYLLRDGDEIVETPEEMCWRVARAIATAEARFGRSPAAVDEVATAFYEMMVEGYFLPNSPTLMNAGKQNQLQYSACYVLPVGDSMQEIFDSVKAAAIIHQSGGGCIGRGANVVTGDGPVAIEDLFRRAEQGIGLPEVLSFDEKTFRMQWVPIRQAHKYEAPEVRTFEVTIDGGVRLITSHWHPFYVLENSGITTKVAEALRPGDLVLSSTGSPLRYQSIGPDLAWLYGLLLADGTFGTYRPTGSVRLRLTDPNPEVVADAAEILNRTYGTRIQARPSTDRRYTIPMWELASSHEIMGKLLHDVDLEAPGPKAAGIRVPRMIWTAAADEQLAFLVGFADGDGHLNRNKKALEITTVSAAFAQDLVYLAGAMGLPCRTRTRAGRLGARPTHDIIFSLARCPVLAHAISRVSRHDSRRQTVRSLGHSSTPVALPREIFRPLLDKAGYATYGRRAWRQATMISGSPSFLQRWMLTGRMNLPRTLDILDGLAASPALDADESRLVDAWRHALPAARRVRSVMPCERVELYDLTVDQNQNYLAGEGGAVLVHNTGFAFSRLRPKNDVVRSTGGRASGPVSFLRVFNSATEAVKQGGSRRGANMGVLRVDHPDILEFIECKLDGGITNFNISVAVTDAFMEALAAGADYDLVNPRTGLVTGQLSARDVFQRIVRAAWRTGDPGLVFIDRINRSSANPTPELSLIEATNPCVTGDTLIYTAGGLIRADELARREEATEVTLDARFGVGEWGIASAVFETGVKPVYRLTTQEGYELRLTADHQLMTAQGWKRADELEAGDCLHLLGRKAGFGADGTLAEGRVLGWLVGDGHLKTDGPAVLTFFGDEKRELAPLFAGYVNELIGSQPGDRYHLSANDIAGRDEARIGSTRLARLVSEKYGLTPALKLAGVPSRVLSGAENLQRGFLQALFTANGHVSGSTEKGISVRLTSVSLPLLGDVQRMLLNFGIASRLYATRHEARTVMLPDGRGGRRGYHAQPDHDLVIARDNVARFAREIGFLTSRKQERLRELGASYSRGPYRETFTCRFKVLEPAGWEPVFDLKEPLTHSFVANGLVVHNCGEQSLPPWDACNLGSINVARFAREGEDGRMELDWSELDRVARLAVRFLDDVIEVNPYPLPEIDATVKGNRRIGLGVMGWADLLFTLGIPYDSEEALGLAERLMAFVNEKGHDQSARLADERGPFANWSRSVYRRGRPRRNSTVTTVAPTGTISMIAGCSSGIEPVFALAFEHRVKSGEGERVLPFVSDTFERLARQRGFHSDAVMAEIVRHGSVQDVADVPAEARAVFKTAHEIDYGWHVRHQAAFQKHTDNGVSKTINLPREASEDDVANAYRMAWELGCLGITVFRDGCKGVQVLNAGVRGPDAPAAVEERGVKPRPHSLAGKTYRMETPIGTAFITVNETSGGDPFEVFVQVGKAGSDTMAVAEALGRLISLVLRLPSPLSAPRRLEEVVSQLSRIGGGQPTGFGAARILSLPDALARTLREHMGGPGGEASQASEPNTSVRRVGDLCKECGQATFIYEEGCKKCLSCGYNEC